MWGPVVPRAIGLRSRKVVRVAAGGPLRHPLGEDVDIKARQPEPLGIIDGDSTTEAIRAARRLNPEFPGELDWPAWWIGQRWCRPDSTGLHPMPFDRGLCEEDVTSQSARRRPPGRAPRPGPRAPSSASTAVAARARPRGPGPQGCAPARRRSRGGSGLRVHGVGRRSSCASEPPTALQPSEVCGSRAIAQQRGERGRRARRGP